MRERKFILGTVLPGILLFGIGLIFGVAALFHAAAIVFPNLVQTVPEVPAWRHAIFVAINGGVAAGILLRDRVRSRAFRNAFRALFAILCVQQLASHGGDAWRAWSGEHRVDYASLGVLLVMPLTLILLWRAPPPESR